MGNMASILLLSLMIASEVLGGMRQTVLAELDQLPNTWRELGLQARINDGASRAFALGTEVTFHFRAEQDSYLSMVHVDSHGALSLFTPRLGESDSLLTGRRTSSYPSASARVAAVIAPPLGRERVYVVATQQPIDTAKIEQMVNAAPGQVAPEAAAVTLARLFRERVLGAGDASAVVKLDYHVLGRSQDIEYTSQDIVGYFTQRPKSIYRPSLDVHINFVFDSDALDDKAQEALNVWGEALQDPALDSAVFTIGGHTDDVGTAAYNLHLSQRRAEKVQVYLTQKFHLNARRFRIKAYGESRPLEPAQSPAARAANRRVEFELAHDYGNASRPNPRGQH
jgi:outer membrane protein OmpA-like peptidoglycan-associated protein